MNNQLKELAKQAGIGEFGGMPRCLNDLLHICIYQSLLKSMYKVGMYQNV
jgi:hypothetical protein